ncbi:hypothetical protein HBI73_228760 [Parastagonospora nodorum]|nr:hypothetical protein HBI73_228760 [Parastagonospora nodorum]KAH5389719.1 hypothetical protein HBI32_249690 [Parastagonospora nodorum]KAH5393895.1 hypothetical protein HBI47_245910 [Parastagonospora nodorum]KAH5617560.1 hypothetical protein HBI23_253850 [Parastagonospora nodorum]
MQESSSSLLGIPISLSATLFLRSRIRCRTANPSHARLHPSDLSVKELKRLLDEKTEEKRSATNCQVTQKPDIDVQGGTKWQIIAKGGDIATERFQIPRTDIAVKQLQHDNLLENFINEKKRNRRYGL